MFFQTVFVHCSRFMQVILYSTWVKVWFALQFSISIYMPLLKDNIGIQISILSNKLFKYICLFIWYRQTFNTILFGLHFSPRLLNLCQCAMSIDIPFLRHYMSSVDNNPLVPAASRCSEDNPWEFFKVYFLWSIQRNTTLVFLSCYLQQEKFSVEWSRRQRGQLLQKNSRTGFLEELVSQTIWKIILTAPLHFSVGLQCHIVRRIRISPIRKSPSQGFPWIGFHGLHKRQ